MNAWQRAAYGALVALLIVFLGLPAAQAASLRQPAQAAADLAEIDAYVWQKAAESSIPGIAYAIVADGQVVRTAAHGVARPDGAPMTPQTPSLIGSVGKTITALAAQQLIQAGKLDPDAPVQRYLPAFRLADEQAAAQITVRQLIEHTSGLSTLAGNDPIFYAPGVSAPELVQRMARIAPDRPVGAGFEYSNLNYLVLGQVIEAAAGMPYADYVRARIFQPLGMTHSFLTRAEARAAGGAVGYRFYYGLPVAEDRPLPEGAAAAGFHFSSAEDMAHYLIAFAGHGQYQGISVIHPDGLPRPQDAQVNYNIDWLPRGSGGGNTEGHSGAWLTYSAGLLFMPQEQIGVVVLANATPAQLLPARSAFEIAYDVLRLYTGNPVGPARQPLATLYLMLDLGLAGLAGLVVWRWLGLRGWRPTPTGRVGLWLADVTLPALLLVALPAAAAALPGQVVIWPWWNWSRLFFAAPDLAFAWFVSAAAWLALGLVKSIRLLRRAGGQRPAAEPASV